MLALKLSWVALTKGICYLFLPEVFKCFYSQMNLKFCWRNCKHLVCVTVINWNGSSANPALSHKRACTDKTVSLTQGLISFIDFWFYARICLLNCVTEISSTSVGFVQ